MRKKEMIAMLLAGGQGSRLGVLTAKVAKPAVAFGGKYRIIDFPLSNCINSGIDTVGVLTQYQPLRLNTHIGIGISWDLDRNFGGVTILPPYEKSSNSEWYTGTANAIYQNLDYIETYHPDYVLILSGDHIYKMDYEIMLFTDEEEGFRLSSVTPLSTEKIYSYGKEMINKEKLSRIINEESFSSAPDEEDIVIFYYAGHGEERTGNLVYSYSYESGKYSDSTMSARDLYDDFLSQWEGRKLIILDSCYSGNFIEDGDLAESVKFEDGKNKGYDLSKALTLSFNSLSSNESAKTDCYVLSAAHKDQLAYEAESLKHGYFTYAILDYFGYDFENEEAVYTTKFDKKSIRVEDLYEAAIDHYPYKNSLKISSPSTTLSRFDMVIFDFK